MSHPSAAVCVSIVDQADRAGPAQPCGCVCTAQTSSSRAGPGRNAARLPQAAGAGPLPPLYFDSKERRQTGRAGGRCTRKPCQPTARPDDSDVGFCPSRSATRTGSGRGGPRPAAYWPGGSCRGCRPSNAAAAAPPRRPKPVRGVGSLSRRRCTDFPVASAACPPESRRRPASRRGGRRRRFPRQSESALQVGPRPGAARPALEGIGGLHRAGLGRTDR